MNFLDSLPYKIGTPFDQINIDLELKKKYTDNLFFYRSYRYSEIFLFERILESTCYLWFNKNALETVSYRFHSSLFNHFEESINAELPEDENLFQDPNIKEARPYIYINKMAISLVKLNNDYFSLVLSRYPSLPIIKTKKNH
ncbi:hypothetical protein RBU60_06450 [Mesonia sp. MT50]|uniref:Uncharacterized protein n=1 Tax=Mesonia profundi TaxID=3070998 RepID=A0ABU1A0I7_9FLAO|nr:hypothetical protein [Mesonia profundi]MDQ7917209.1 hypothetical protein [Mesonia profundi]